MTNCVSDTEFPALSVAVQVTIVSPKGKTSGALLVISGRTSIISEICGDSISIILSNDVASNMTSADVCN